MSYHRAEAQVNGGQTLPRGAIQMVGWPVIAAMRSKSSS
jgi:hypothetical protein